MLQPRGAAGLCCWDAGRRAWSTLGREGPAGSERRGTCTSVRITLASLVSASHCPLPPPDRSGRGLWLWHPLVFRRPGRGEEDLRGEATTIAQHAEVSGPRGPQLVLELFYGLGKHAPQGDLTPTSGEPGRSASLFWSLVSRNHGSTGLLDGRRCVPSVTGSEPARSSSEGGRPLAPGGQLVRSHGPGWDRGPAPSPTPRLCGVWVTASFPFVYAVVFSFRFPCVETFVHEVQNRNAVKG